ncbi:hypothetical protein Tco_0179392 [Tanacetum coccineum]
MIQKESIQIESFKFSTQHSTVNDFVVINIPEEDIETKQIILDADDCPMWESAKTVAPTPNSAIVQIDVDDNFVINIIHLKMIQENKFNGYLRANPDSQAHDSNKKDQHEDFEEFMVDLFTLEVAKAHNSKGRIRVSNLDFDSVSFVKELGHFNLFSISQICDKQHKVLFTETECLVVSSDFKMPDEIQILLKVPRHHNMYSFDMKTPTPVKGFACLIAKATSDESKM